MKTKAQRKILIILEQEWGENFGPNCSVAPFIKGANEVAKKRLQQKIEHSWYSDLKDFEIKLQAATEDKGQTYIIYLAAHGDYKHLGNSRLINILAKINSRAVERNIEGLLVGSCLTGNTEGYYDGFMRGCSLKWAIAYKCIVNWLDGTIIDTRVLDSFLHAGEPPKGQIQDYLYDNLVKSLSLFDSSTTIGESKSGINMTLEESLMILFQESGRGQVPKAATASSLFLNQEICSHCESEM